MMAKFDIFNANLADYSMRLSVTEFVKIIYDFKKKKTRMAMSTQHHIQKKYALHHFS